MLTPSGVTANEYINAIRNGNQQHVRITFESDNVVFYDEDIDLDTGIRLTNYLNAEIDLTFGKAVCSTVSIAFIRSLKTDSISWTNEFKLEFGVEINGTTSWVTVGYYIPTMPDRLVSNVINIVAYDRMQLFEISAESFLKTITYPTTLSNIYTNLCSYIGVPKVPGNEIASNLNRSITSSPFASDNGVICRDLLAVIAEAVGCYAKINSSGNVQMVWYQDHKSDYSLDRNHIYNIEVGDIAWNLTKTWGDLEQYTWGQLASYTWGDLAKSEGKYQISAIRIVQSKDDIGITYPENVTDRNVYLIVDNPFLYGATSSESRSYIVPLYERVSALGTYIPATIESFGNWLIEAGDIINIEIADSNFTAFPIFNRSIYWNGHCGCTYETTGNLERGEVSGDIKQKLTNGGQIHEFVVDIDKTFELIQDQFGNYYTKTETASYVSQKMGDELGNYYTKTETASLISTTMSDSLGNYYTKTETASLVSTAISSASGNYIARTSVYQTASSIVAAAEQYTDENAYKIVSGIAIEAAGVTIAGSKYVKINTNNTNNWSFEGSGLKYTKKISGVDYSIGIGYANNYYNNGGIYFNPNGTSGGSVQLQAKDSSGNYQANIFLTCSGSSSAGYSGSFYQTGTNGNATITLGTSNYPWYTSYLRNIKGPDTQICIYPNEASSGYVMFSYNYTGWLEVVPAGFTNRSNLGQASARWSNLYVGDVNYTGSLTQGSSRDIKHDIKAMNSCGDRLDKLKPVTFVYNKDGNERQRMGLIYEDTIGIVPEICTKDESNKAISYVELIPMLLKEIQDLRQRIKIIESK